MRFYLLVLLLITLPLNAMIIKDPKVNIPEGTKAGSYDILPTYNPYSIYVPSRSTLEQLSATRVLDLGASAYAANFPKKAIYFYTNAIDIFSGDGATVAWATYETGFIYYNKRQYKKALEYFDKVDEVRGAPSTAQNLAKMMTARLRNQKEYNTLQKQEDVVFLADKKAQSVLDKQIAKEERNAEKLQRELAKERKRREKEEAKLLKDAEKAEKARLKEEAKLLKEAEEK